MGPRMFIRGIELITSGRVKITMASMGPRMFIRGIRRIRAGCRRPSSSFNGAADVHPRNRGRFALPIRGHVRASMGPRMFIRGIRRRGSDRPPSRHRFNGAADVHPRNPTREWLQHHYCELASMGPRMFIRGIPQRAGIAEARPIASMGPRMFIRGIVIRPPPFARCGARRFNGAADVHPRNHRRAARRGRGRRASMGPRMFIRGIHPGKRDLLALAAASMGPRMFIRGIRRGQGGRLRPSTQWAADVHPGITSGERLRGRRFNGAADVHPRNPDKVEQDIGSAPRLQWGRGCSSAESAGVGRVAPRGARLQWGRGCSSAESADLLSILLSKTCVNVCERRAQSARGAITPNP